MSPHVALILNLWRGMLNCAMSRLVPVPIYTTCPGPRPGFTPYVPVPVLPHPEILYCGFQFV